MSELTCPEMTIEEEEMMHSVRALSLWTPSLPTTRTVHRQLNCATQSINTQDGLDSISKNHDQSTSALSPVKSTGMPVIKSLRTKGIETTQILDKIARASKQKGPCHAILHVLQQLQYDPLGFITKDQVRHEIQRRFHLTSHEVKILCSPLNQIAGHEVFHHQIVPLFRQVDWWTNNVLVERQLKHMGRSKVSLRESHDDPTRDARGILALAESSTSDQIKRKTKLAREFIHPVTTCPLGHTLMSTKLRDVEISHALHQVGLDIPPARVQTLLQRSTKKEDGWTCSEFLHQCTLQIQESASGPTPASASFPMGHYRRQHATKYSHDFLHHSMKSSIQHQRKKPGKDQDNRDIPVWKLRWSEKCIPNAGPTLGLGGHRKRMTSHLHQSSPVMGSLLASSDFVHKQPRSSRVTLRSMVVAPFATDGS